MPCVMFYAIVTTSDAVVEHINVGRYWNFMELYVWGKSSETLWNFIRGLMERNNYGSHEGDERCLARFVSLTVQFVM